MPIYEYICNTCNTGRKFSALVGVVANAPEPRCPRCGGEDIRRAVSRFARLRSEDEAIDSLAEQAESMDMEDPRAVRRLMKEMASEMGEDVSADELEEMMESEMDSAGDSGTDSLGED
ncbi:MAG: zinc ribbon domain-containing protein [Armatimonadaceae bacterium]